MVKNLLIGALAAVAATSTSAAASDYLKGNVIDLNTANFDDVVGNFEFVLIAFGAHWCPYSRALQPVFRGTATIMKQDNIRLAFINCENSKPLCQRFAITKYPTMKLFKDSFPRALEYRGSRDVTRISAYLERETSAALKVIGAEKEFQDVSNNGPRKSVLTKIPSVEGEAVLAGKMRTIADNLREFCDFYLLTGSKRSTVSFKLKGAIENYKQAEYDELETWLTNLCKPLIDELTFENSEAVVEEQLPLIILFTRPDDHASIKMYKQAVENNVKHERHRVKFLYADGTKFVHPLQHIHKTVKDLPVLAIDSFKHLYDFDHPLDDINKEGVFQTFINDLFNSQHHEHFHRGNPNAETCTWRQTGDCRATGPREPHADKGCGEAITESSSGTCECGHGELLHFDCQPGRGTFNCFEKCAEAQKNHKADMSHCMWRQTNNCDPDGEREDTYDSDCDTLIQKGRSGYCECGFNGHQLKFTCDHLDFICRDKCIEANERYGEKGDSGKIEEKKPEPVAGKPGKLDGLNQKGSNGAEKLENKVKPPRFDPSKNEPEKSKSEFEKLGPSKKRYSFVNHDEL